MQRRIKRISLLLLIILVIFSMSSCGGKDKAASSGLKGEATVSKLVVAIPDDPGTLTFLSAMGAESYYNIVGQMYDCLFEYGVNNELTPEIAESWEKTDDLHYLFHLRDGVKFSDGTPLKASDVVFSLKMASTDPAASQGVAGVNFDETKVIDESTVQVGFKSAFIVNFINLAAVRIAGEEVYNNSEDGLKTSAYGTGAYMLKSYNPGNSVVMVKNPYYWGEEPSIDEIELQIIPDTSQRTNALMAGDVDIIQNPTITDLSYFEEESGYEVESLITWKSMGIFLNTTSNSACEDVHLRRAIAYSIDKGGILETVYKGYGSVSVAPFTETFIDFDDNFIKDGYYDYNIDKAKEELAKADIPEDTKLTIILTNATESQSEAQIIQALLAPIGVDTEIKTYDPAVYFGVMTDSTAGWDIALQYTTCPSGLAADLVDAWIMHLGITGYKAPSVVDAIGEVKQLGDIEEMKEANRVIYEKIIEDVPMFAYTQSAINVAYSSRLKDFNWWGRGSFKYALYSVE